MYLFEMASGIAQNDPDLGSHDPYASALSGITGMCYCACPLR